MVSTVDVSSAVSDDSTGASVDEVESVVVVVSSVALEESAEAESVEVVSVVVSEVSTVV